jgi:hypothetical protein
MFDPIFGEVALGVTESPAVSVPGRWAQDAVDRERCGGETIWPKKNKQQHEHGDPSPKLKRKA